MAENVDTDEQLISIEPLLLLISSTILKTDPGELDPYPHPSPPKESSSCFRNLDAEGSPIFETLISSPEFI